MKFDLRQLTAFASSPLIPLVLTLALGLPRLRFPIGTDAALYSLSADLILGKGVLYRDMWLNVFPLNSIIYAGFESFLGLKPVVPHLIHLVESLAGVGLVYAGGKLLLGSRQALLGAYIFGLSSMLFVQFDAVAEPDIVAGLTITAAVVMLLESERRQANLLLLAAGLVSGLAVAAKPVALPVVLVLFFLASRSGERVRNIVLYGAGLVAVPLVLLVWLLSNGALSDILEQVVVFNNYYNADRGPFSGFLYALILEALAVGPALPLAGVGAALIARAGKGKRLWLVLWAGAGVAGVLWQAKSFSYHWFLVLPALSLLASQPFSSEMRLARPRLLFWAVALSVALSVLRLGVPVDNLAKEAASVAHIFRTDSEEGFLDQFRYMGGSIGADQLVASYLENHTEESTPIFSWRSGIYVMSDRRPASKHAYILPFFYGPEELQGKARRELISDLRLNRPQYMVLPAGSGWRWQMMPGVAFPIDPFEELNDLVSSEYLLEAEVGGSAIYRIR